MQYFAVDAMSLYAYGYYEQNSSWWRAKWKIGFWVSDRTQTDSERSGHSGWYYLVHAKSTMSLAGIAQTADPAFHHIPIMWISNSCHLPLNHLSACSDLGSISSADIATRQELVNQVRNACMKVGFFYGTWITEIKYSFLHAFVVKNHGIPEEIVQNALFESKEFFSLPIEQKMEASIC